MKRLAMAVMLTLCFPLMTGCPIALIGAGMGMAKSGGAKKTAAATERRKAYSDYTIEMEKINLEREKAKLAPKPIATFEEWDQEKSTATVPSK